MEFLTSIRKDYARYVDELKDPCEVGMHPFPTTLDAVLQRLALLVAYAASMRGTPDDRRRGVQDERDERQERVIRHVANGIRQLDSVGLLPENESEVHYLVRSRERYVGDNLQPAMAALLVEVVLGSEGGMKFLESQASGMAWMWAILRSRDAPSAQFVRLIAIRPADLSAFQRSFPHPQTDPNPATANDPPAVPATLRTRAQADIARGVLLKALGDFTHDGLVVSGGFRMRQDVCPSYTFLLVLPQDFAHEREAYDEAVAELSGKLEKKRKDLTDVVLVSHKVSSLKTQQFVQRGEGTAVISLRIRDWEEDKKGKKRADDASDANAPDLRFPCEVVVVRKNSVGIASVWYASSPAFRDSLQIRAWRRNLVVLPDAIYRNLGGGLTLRIPTPTEADVFKLLDLGKVLLGGLRHADCPPAPYVTLSGELVSPTGYATMGGWTAQHQWTRGLAPPSELIQQIIKEDDPEQAISSFAMKDAHTLVRTPFFEYEVDSAAGMEDAEGGDKESSRREDVDVEEEEDEAEQGEEGTPPTSPSGPDFAASTVPATLSAGQDAQLDTLKTLTTATESLATALAQVAANLERSSLAFEGSARMFQQSSQSFNNTSRSLLLAASTRPPAAPTSRPSLARAWSVPLSRDHSASQVPAMGRIGGPFSAVLPQAAASAAPAPSSGTTPVDFPASSARHNPSSRVSLVARPASGRHIDR
ncbi:hypothetical protein OF846_005052 [Rhodotorula toruloides]|nr:hypothetical protein OF846_005052 [Rhodotorula toruloides]